MIPEIITYITLVVLLVAMIITMFRLIKGPSLLDRVVAMDLFTAVTSGFIVVMAILSDVSFYIDIVIILSLVSFIGTVAISKYLHKKEHHD